MIRQLFVISSLVVGSALVLGACAASDDSGGGGSAGTGGTDGGGTDGGGSGGTSATGGSGGTSATGGSGGTSATGGASGSGGAAGAGGADAGCGSDGGVTTSISGAIIDLLTQQPVADLQVCIYGNSCVPCVKTDTTGHYLITGVPANQEVLVEYTKNTYLPAIVTVKTTTSSLDAGIFPAPTNAAANAFAATVGTTIDPTKGHVLFTTLQPGTSGYAGQDGVSVSMSPMSGVGPYYVASNNLPDKTLTATSTAGFGLFANVDPGDVEVTMTHPSKTCGLLPTAWPGTGSTTAKVKVVTGYLTGGAALLCP